MTSLQPILKALSPLLLLLPQHGRTPPQKVQAAAPTPAYVTIYSSPLNLHSFMPGTKNGIYAGRIFEGDHLLVHIRPSHFVTFAVPPGSHTFAANCLTCKSSSGGGAITLDLQPGQHTFVQASMKIAVTASGMAFILKEVRCAEAQSSNQKSMAIAEKDIQPEGAKLIVPDTSFPPCPATATATDTRPTTP